jgi:hypothetical protein
MQKVAGNRRVPSTDKTAAATSLEAVCGLMVFPRTPISVITTTNESEATEL